MNDNKLQRQFHGTCALIQVQMMRAAECRNIEKCYIDLTKAGKITQDDVVFIKNCLELDNSQDFSQLDEQTVNERIARLHSIVASKLNVADSA